MTGLGRLFAKEVQEKSIIARSARHRITGEKRSGKPNLDSKPKRASMTITLGDRTVIIPADWFLLSGKLKKSKINRYQELIAWLKEGQSNKEVANS